MALLLFISMSLHALLSASPSSWAFLDFSPSHRGIRGLSDTSWCIIPPYTESLLWQKSRAGALRAPRGAGLGLWQADVSNKGSSSYLGPDPRERDGSVSLPSAELGPLEAGRQALPECSWSWGCPKDAASGCGESVWMSISPPSSAVQGRAVTGLQPCSAVSSWVSVPAGS